MNCAECVYWNPDDDCCDAFECNGTECASLPCEQPDGSVIPVTSYMITILCGKSASGKDTLLRELVKRGDFVPLVSTTTRPPREGEVEGKDYFFVSREEFEKRKAEGKFVEMRSYNTLVGGKKDVWFYGLEKQELEGCKDYVVILDLGGAEECRRHYGKANTLIFYVDAPDALRRTRAESRGSFDDTEWNRRLLDDDVVFSDDRVMEVCDMTINNSGSVETLLSGFDDAFEHFTNRK